MPFPVAPLVTFDPRLELHPMLVHFPIVLLVLSFSLDAAGFLLKKDWLHRAGLAALALGVVAVAAGVGTGLLTPEADANGIGIRTTGGLAGFFKGNTVMVHQNLAFLLLFATVVWLAFRLTLWGRAPAAQAAYLGLGLVVVVLVGVTGYYGGDIVYGPQVTVSHLSNTHFEAADP